MLGGYTIFSAATLAAKGVLRAIEDASQGIVTWEGAGDGLVVDLQVGRVVGEFTGGLAPGDKSPHPKPANFPVVSAK